MKQQSNIATTYYPGDDVTTKLSFTRASIRRAIAGAQAAGLRVVGIKPDGTVT